MARLLCWMSAVGALVCAIWLCAQLATGLAIAAALGSMLLFALPGTILASAFFGTDVRRFPEVIIFGATIGLALSEYAAILVGYIHGWSVTGIVVSIAVLTLAALAIAWRFRRGPILANVLRAWSATDYSILFGMCLVLTLFVAVPYLNVGKLTPDGYAYTWLFGFDFLLRSAIANSLTLGLPPDYLHLSGEPLRYYLASYSLPAFAYSATAKSASMHAIMLVQQLLLSFLLLGCLFAFLRRFISSARALALTGFTIVLFYSYYGLYPILKRLLLSNALPLPSWVTNPATRGTYGGMSHLYQRLFLVEPQAMTGICVLVTVMFLLAVVEYRLKSRMLAVVLGLLLGIEFGIEGWQGLVLAVWFGAVVCWDLLKDFRQLRRRIWQPFIAVVICTAVYASFFAIGMYELSSGKALLIAPYMWVIKHGFIYFPVEYGPMLILGVWGLIWQFRRDRESVSVPLLILVGLSLVQIFFVTAAVLPEFGLLRGNRILPIALLVWTGYLLQKLLEGKKRKAVAIVIGLMVVALPTIFTDIHYSSNVSDRENTRYIRPEDRRACEWIKANIEESAIVQNEPDYVGQDNVSRDAPVAMSLIANFADRRMAVGEQWIASTIIVNSKEKAINRFLEVHKMFRATAPDVVTSIAAKNRVDYIYVGPYERKLYPEFLRTLQAAPSSFAPVYSSDGVYIFRRVARSSLFLR